jgi:L-asparaginase
MARLDFEITVLTFENLWILLTSSLLYGYAKSLEKPNEYDSFVIIHGTDTMAYSISFELFIRNLNKPVILTGAQLPIGVARTDAKENFITALEIAAKQNGRPIISSLYLL